VKSLLAYKAYVQSLSVDCIYVCVSAKLRFA